MPKPNLQEDADDLKIDPNNVINSDEITAPLEVPDVYVETDCPVKSRIQTSTSPEGFMQQMLRHHDDTQKNSGEPCTHCKRVILQREQMMPGLVDRARNLRGGAPVFGQILSAEQSPAHLAMEAEIKRLRDQNDTLVLKLLGAPDTSKKPADASAATQK